MKICLLSSQIGLALKPLLVQISTSVISSKGFSNQAELGSLSKTSNKMGAAVCTPTKPGLPSPSALPTQTPTTKSLVAPIAQASLNPKLVPVFHAICLEESKNSQFSSASGLFTSFKLSKVR